MLVLLPSTSLGVMTTIVKLARSKVEVRPLRLTTAPSTPQQDLISPPETIEPQP